MLINHVAKVSFGIEAPWGHRKINIQRNKLYLKIQDGRRRPLSETGPTQSPEPFCHGKYYDTCFLGNWESLKVFSA